MCAAVWRHLVKAMEVIAGLAESNGSLPPDGGLKVTDCLYTRIISGPNARVWENFTFTFIHSYYEGREGSVNKTSF